MSEDKLQFDSFTREKNSKIFAGELVGSYEQGELSHGRYFVNSLNILELPMRCGRCKTPVRDNGDDSYSPMCDCLVTTGYFQAEHYEP